MDEYIFLKIDESPAADGAEMARRNDRACRDLAEEAGMARHIRAMEFFRNEIQSLERAPELNGCTMTQEWQDQIDAYRYAIAACNKFMEEKDRAKE